MGTSFSDAPRQQLANLLRSDGAAVLDEPDRCLGWLLYACPGRRREVNVVVAALRLGVPQALLAGASAGAEAGRMMDELAMEETAARWAAETSAQEWGCLARWSSRCCVGMDVASCPRFAG